MLIGRNPVVEALRAKVPAKALYVQVKMESDDRWREALRLAVAFNIPILEVSHTDMDRLTDGGVHQGLALAVPAYDYADLTDVSTGTLLVALDGVTDPRNLGAIVRSAAAFGADGVVTAQIPGSTAPQSIGTIALANFLNPAGLEPKGQNLYAESTASGQPASGTPGANGLGALMQGFVETSNVNVVQELVTMIQTQRAYEMNSKAIQTSDQMLQKLGQL